MGGFGFSYRVWESLSISTNPQPVKESLARESVATPCQARQVCQATWSGEACPRQALQRPILDYCTYLNGIARMRAAYIWSRGGSAVLYWTGRRPVQYNTALPPRDLF